MHFNDECILLPLKGYFDGGAQVSSLPISAVRMEGPNCCFGDPITVKIVECLYYMQSAVAWYVLNHCFLLKDSRVEVVVLGHLRVFKMSNSRNNRNF
jgi:hypothetical protein